MVVKNPKPIENYSPFEIRQFLIKVLTVKDWANNEKYNFQFIFHIIFTYLYLLYIN